MAWEVWKSSRGGNKCNSDHEVMLSKDKEGRICIYLSVNACKRLRWKKGDQVRIKFDHDDKLVALERTSDQGNRLGVCGSNGKRLRVVFQLPQKLADVCVNGSSRRFMKDEWIDSDGMLVVEMVKHA